MSILLSECKAIGYGSYGRVYVGRHNDTDYAVKRRYIVQSETVPPGCVHVNEIDIMCRIKHPNILNAISMQQINPIPDNFRITGQTTSGEQSDVKFRADLVYLMTQKCDGDLSDVVVTKGGKLDNTSIIDLRSIMWQILDGLSCLHANNMIHRDIKPANILYTGGKDNVYTIKICDFDMCLPDLPKITLAKAMTPEYTPPEVLVQDVNVKYSKANDIWGAGCTLYHLVTGEQIASRKGQHKDHVDEYILAVQLANLPNGNTISYKYKYIDPDVGKQVKLNLDLGDPQANDLMLKMLDCDPSKRPTVLECMQHPFFSGTPIPTYYPDNDFVIEKHMITEDMATIFDNQLSMLPSDQYYGFFLGLDIMMRVCTKKYKGDGRNLAICCFNLGMKYYYKEVAPFEHIDNDAAKRIEFKIISSHLKGKLYRDTIYNHIGCKSVEIYKYLMAPDYLLPCKFSSLLQAIRKNLNV